MSAIFAAPPLGHAATGATTTFVSLPDGVHIAGLAVGASAVWATNGRAGTVVRLDPRTNQVVATIPVAAPSPDCDRCWGAVAARGDVVWAAMDTAGPVVARIDPASNAVAETVAVGLLPFALAPDEEGGLWLTATMEDAVVHVNPHIAGAVARTAVHFPAGIIVDHDAVWVTASKPGSTGQVVRIDPHTGVVLATIPVGHDPDALAVADTDVWVANEADHTVSRIDARTNTVRATIPVVHGPVGVAIGADVVWGVSRGSALLAPPTLSGIDPDSNSVVESYPLEAADPLSVAAGAGSLWVSSRNLDEAVRIGPLPLPDSAPAAGGQPLLPIALGAGAMLALAACFGRRQSARPGRDPTVPAGHLLKTLLLRQQASRRAAGQSVLHGRLSACPTPGSVGVNGGSVIKLRRSPRSQQRKE